MKELDEGKDVKVDVDKVLVVGEHCSSKFRFK